MLNTRVHLKLAVALIGATLLAACGGSGTAGGQADGANGQLTPLTFQLNWTWYAADHVYFEVAQQKGFYKEAGLNVTIREGNGSQTTLKLIGTGDVQLGYVGAGAMMRGVAQGMSTVKSIGVVNQVSPLAVIFKAKKDFDSFGDLNGARIAGTQGDSTGQVFPAALAAAGMSMDDVEFVPTGNPQAKEVAVLQGNADGLLGYFNEQAPRLEANNGVEMDYIRFSSTGVNILNMAVLANTGWLEDNRDTARAFVQATQRAIKYTVENPMEAAKIFAAEHSSQFSKKLAHEEIKASIPLLHTQATEGKPYLVTAKKDWKQSQRLLTQYTDLEAKRKVSTYYTNELAK